MIATTRAMLAAACLLVSSPVFAQSDPCGLTSYHRQDKLYGCMDFPPAGSTVTRSAPLEIHGWALSCWTAQQPASVQVRMSEAAVGGARSRLLAPSEFTIAYRVERPDVRDYFQRLDALDFVRCPDLTTPYLGYVLTINAGVLPTSGSTVLAVIHADPSLARFAVGVNVQQVRLRVVE